MSGIRGKRRCASTSITPAFGKLKQGDGEDKGYIHFSGRKINKKKGEWGVKDSEVMEMLALMYPC